ncbi:MAG TPA: NAD-dependent epimerase/dehydratase family protein [Solirubrobacter sp.]|nr:NAD-dependent epimerase/dehydratase family protein [Solirubrobacter sp.]
MHIFIAGATGAAGRALIPHLIENGHTVTGTSRSAAKAEQIEALGATPAVMDGLDPQSVSRAIADADPDVIVHQMTALSDMKVGKIDRQFAVTNQLRTKGTQLLIDAMKPGTLLIAQSFAGWPYARTGGPIKTEEDPLDPDPPKGIRETHAAIRTLERLTTEAGGIVLRYGAFYGPGTGLAPDGDQTEMIFRRKIPIVGNGEGIWSMLHVEDLATATLAAIEHGKPGEIYNIVDDDPAPIKEWLPFLAAKLGAPPPRKVPAFVARLVAGPAAVMMMTTSRGASNEKAKRELNWAPQHSWKELRVPVAN